MIMYNMDPLAVYVLAVLVSNALALLREKMPAVDKTGEFNRE